MLIKLIIVIIVIYFVAMFYFMTVYRAKNTAKYPFACPDCGERFTAEWKPLLISNLYLYTRGWNTKKLGPFCPAGVLVKCPKCNAKKLCKRPYDFE